MLDKTTVKELALANGFKLKEQADGSMDLNPYVYQFAAALIQHSLKDLIDNHSENLTPEGIRWLVRVADIEKVSEAIKTMMELNDAR